MPYTELILGNTLEENIDTQTAKREFITDASGDVANLPLIGELFDADPSHAFLRCRSRNRVYYGGRFDVFKWVCSYSTPHGGHNPPDDTIVIGSKDFDKLNGTMEVGVESVVIDVNSEGENPGFKWETSIAGTDKVYQPTFRLIPSGSFIIPQKVSDIANFNGISIAKAGSVNADEFKGFPAETVLYMGHSQLEDYNSDGNKIFTVSMMFQWKIIPMATSATAVEFGGWNHFPRRVYDSAGTVTQEGWSRMQHRRTKAPMYRLTNFNGLLVS